MKRDIIWILKCSFPIKKDVKIMIIVDCEAKVIL